MPFGADGSAYHHANNQSAVYKLLSKADYYSYRNAIDTVSQALKDIKVE